MLKQLINTKHKQVLIKTQRFYSNYNNHIISIENLLIKQSKIVNPDWGAIRKEVLEIDSRKINPNNVDYMILSQCNDDNTRKLAVEYAKYLEKQGEGLNLASISRLLKIYGFVQRQDDNKSIQVLDIEAEIIKLYKKLITKHKILDASLTESVIYALSTTKDWKICIDLFKTLENTLTPSTLTYDAIISALFLHSHDELAWKYLQEMVDKERKPGDCTYLSYLSHVDSNSEDYSEFVTQTEALFNFWSNNDIIINEVIADKLQELFKKMNKKAVITTITVKGDCPKCKSRLPECVFSDEDFYQLKTAFFERVMIGKDVFRKTTPQELAGFKNFLSDKQHYDVIIDGLNVAFSAGVKKSPDAASGLVLSVVEHYARQNKRILVLGRSHMNRWPHIGKIKRYSRLFLTQNLSQDDPYLLYCALNSGQGTIIVSRDMMRGHLHLLKEPWAKQLFKRWLAISRHQLINMKKDGKLIINAPPTYILSAQKQNNVWHLPLFDEKPSDEQKNGLAMKSEPTLWLCISL